MTIPKLKLKLQEDLKHLPGPVLLQIEALVQKSIRSKKEAEPTFRRFGSMSGVLQYMAPDFNEPIGDFQEYQ